jgi:hypothetical protein
MGNGKAMVRTLLCIALALSAAGSVWAEDRVATSPRDASVALGTALDQDSPTDDGVAADNDASPDGDPSADGGNAPASTPPTYTWDDLVALVPDLRSMSLVETTADGSPERSYAVCEMVRRPGSLIRRRRCYDLRTYVAIKSAQRARARNAAIAIQQGTFVYSGGQMPHAGMAGPAGMGPP